MTRRYPVLSRPLPHTSTGEAIGVVLGTLAIVLATMAGIWLAGQYLVTPAHAHDSWISRGQWRNPAGEWCCGAQDCGVLSPGAVHAVKGGYSVHGTVIYNPVATDAGAVTPPAEHVDELVPYSQALPSPDGAYWRCKRPDGSPRCFFAPPPGS